MHTKRLNQLALSILVLLLASLACSSVAPAPTAVPPSPVPPTVTLTATATLRPTSTPRPTATPNLAATQQFQARQELLQAYVEKGYLASTAGEFEDLLDFNEEWAQLNWYQWWPIHTAVTSYGDLVFQAHFSWQTATKTSDLSGCGIVFGAQPNQDHYAVFIDKARIAFLMSRGGNVYQVGKTTGSGRLSLQEPAEADVAVIVRAATSWVLVNDTATQYTLSADQTSSGEFARSLLSGTNKGFGTRCSITDSYLFLPQE